MNTPPTYMSFLFVMVSSLFFVCQSCNDNKGQHLPKPISEIPDLGKYESQVAQDRIDTKELKKGLTFVLHENPYSFHDGYTMTIRINHMVLYSGQFNNVVAFEVPDYEPDAHLHVKLEIVSPLRSEKHHYYAFANKETIPWNPDANYLYCLLCPRKDRTQTTFFLMEKPFSGRVGVH